MMRRYCLGLLLGVLLAGQSGCCCFNWDFGHGPAGPLWTRTWCGPQCGGVVWSEWFSFPPLCDDPCDCCGEFACSDNPYVLNGPTEGRFGPIYDDGSGRSRSTARSQGPQSRATPTPAARPTPAPTPAGEMPAPPVEELPSAEPTTAVESDAFGNVVSYDEAVDSPRPLRTVRKPRRLPQ